MIGRTGALISAVGHGVLIVVAGFGLPSSAPDRPAPILVTEVSFVSEAEFAAATSFVEMESPDMVDLPPSPPQPPADFGPPLVIVTAPAAPQAQPEPPSAPTEAMRPAAFPEPALPPEPTVASVEAVAASPEAPATLALQVSSPPMPRPAPPRKMGAESLIEALKREVAKEVAQRKVQP